jgi:glutathione S-transferase
MLRVYGFLASINVRKVLWAAAEAGVPFVRDDWGGAAGRSTADPEFARLSRFGVVPVIDHDGVIVRESNTIVRYLAGVSGRTDLLPADPAGRARVETWMDWQATDLNASWKPAFHALMRSHQATPEAIAASEAAWTKNIGLLDAHLATSRFVAGDAFTVADICIGLALHRWLGTPVAHPAFENCARYYDLIRKRQAFIAHGEPGGP